MQFCEQRPDLQRYWRIHISSKWDFTATGALEDLFPMYLAKKSGTGSQNVAQLIIIVIKMGAQVRAGKYIFTKLPDRAPLIEHLIAAQNIERKRIIIKL